VPRFHAITQANRASWNQIHPFRPGRPADFFASGGSTLEDIEVGLAGDVAGRRILQLACSCGDEALSWAALGAEVTGVDISEVAVDLARTKADTAGIAADFRQADIFDLPADLTDFDLIYCSWGAICWVPDLTAFTILIADRLRAGGSVLLAEHHPVWEVLAVSGTNHLTVAGSYFGRTTPRRDIDNAKLPTGARDNPDAPAFSTFVWPVSDVVMALLHAGLQLDHFSESPDPDSYPTLGPTAVQLPATYIIKATRPGNVSHETSHQVS
jgi:2-polyprenyl-3-methyl-5-hydroxy-6-metoxy-1,4-benzoquinol methylase